MLKILVILALSIVIDHLGQMLKRSSTYRYFLTRSRKNANFRQMKTNKWWHWAFVMNCDKRWQWWKTNDECVELLQALRVVSFFRLCLTTLPTYSSQGRGWRAGWLSSSLSLSCSRTTSSLSSPITGDDSPDWGEEDEAFEDKAAGKGRGGNLSSSAMRISHWHMSTRASRDVGFAPTCVKFNSETSEILCHHPKNEKDMELLVYVRTCDSSCTSWSNTAVAFGSVCCDNMAWAEWKSKKWVGSAAAYQ